MGKGHKGSTTPSAALGISTPKQGTLYGKQATPYGAVSTRWCSHSGTKVAFRMNGKSLAGARGDLVDPTQADLVVDCAEHYKASASVLSGTAAELIEKLKPWVANPPVLKIDWPDGSAPTRLVAEFWSALWLALPARTVVCCMGGHGRTGTALACLVLAAQACSGHPLSAVAAVRLVREQHCDEAVETTGQEAYIARVAVALNALVAPDATEDEYEAQLNELRDYTRPKLSASRTELPAVWSEGSAGGGQQTTLVDRLAFDAIEDRYGKLPSWSDAGGRWPSGDDTP
jgi:protein-tyrosine phosphatase